MYYDMNVLLINKALTCIYFIYICIFMTFSGQCLLKGTLYEHGERFAPKECAECVCHDGNMQCTRVDPETACPPLPCDAPDQFTVPGECCKFCPGIIIKKQCM